MNVAIRSPVLTIVGHVDHGKTTLLDKIRGTAIAKGEPGLITQHISASYIPMDVINRICGELIRQVKTRITIPGLLFIDTPGHEAFTTLRKRGGAIADLAVLVIDINEGFRPQTDESLNFLKQFKTPFVVALTKIDRLAGWSPQKDAPFLTSFKEQSESAQDALEDRLYRVIGQLGERGIQSERYDRVTDHTKQICIVPVSGSTGEGVADLLMVASGLAQRFLKSGLEIHEGEGKGTVLEVKEYRGLGTTIDVILYDGEIRRGDTLVIGGKETVVTKVKALLKPKPLQDIRVERDFEAVDAVAAADGIKIAAPGLGSVTAGSPLRAVRNEREAKKAEEEVKREIAEVEIETDKEGVILKADTLGSLEALVRSFKGMVSIRRAQVGAVTKADVMEIRTYKEPMIFAFNVRISPEIEKLANDNRVYVFHSDIIYRLIEGYEKWKRDETRRSEDEILSTVTRPGRIRVLRGYVFRQRKPAIFGVEVLKGMIRPGYRLHKKGRVVGEIKELQMEGENVDEARTGSKAAVSMEDVTIGKQIEEGDVLETFITSSQRQQLEKIRSKLTPEERELLEEDTNKEA